MVLNLLLLNGGLEGNLGPNTEIVNAGRNTNIKPTIIPIRKKLFHTKI